MSRGSDWDLALDWVAGDLQIGSEVAGITIEIHGDDPITVEEWQLASTVSGAPSRDDITGLGIVTLSGEIRDGALRALRDYWRVQCRASEFDEVDGFTAD